MNYEPEKLNDYFFVFIFVNIPPFLTEIQGSDLYPFFSSPRILSNISFKVSLPVTNYPKFCQSGKSLAFDYLYVHMDVGSLEG